ncbi:Killer toxin, Kp4 [Cordyceps fumosorosea ARSEF 2679]|uniref:Killer toxin, Kp4 n=1 Tax=Cordyceps fumosorosea (strain ARSEF 2679) TaxID=1081104 RepID=A0A167KT17_CORFA|nr:Killer toxin, Kp4 [Cordyceps fumosorosea ARSEF 2679]OAA52154.1 Killer toxin, Kp4 [Cordyceps fumosorosea ARSEF 2679]
MKTATFTTLVSVLSSSVSALGINCRGSGLCPSDGAAGNLINLKAIVDGISDRNRHYNTGQQIACTGSLCTYFQNGASGTASDASELLQQLRDHGCKKCGSAPTQPGNDVSKGELTVNVVGDPHCQGAC